MRMGWLVGLFLISVASGQVVPSELTSLYCSRTGGVTPTGREAIYTFLNGVETNGLSQCLLDFAFFAEGQNVMSGAPASFCNTGVVIGAINRLGGGYEFPNKSSNNGLYFTNLPPTPQGRTIIVWGTPSYYPNVSNNVNNVIFELTGPGGPASSPDPICSYLAWWTPRPYFFNGAQHQTGPAHTNSQNSFFVAALASGPEGCEGFFKSDYPLVATHFIGTHGVQSSPTVLRLAYRNSLANTNCGWHGVIRGFAYFNTRLTTNQILALDKLVPRVGLIIDGDSKTVSNPWARFWCEMPQTWGLYSIITNAAVSGTVISTANAPSYTNTMEKRWESISHYKIDSQFPRVIYAVRGGHNDFGGAPNVAQLRNMTNAFRAATNLWTKAKAKGYSTLGWTIDRTAVTWSSGNTNMLNTLNSLIRSNAASCDFLFDAESFFVETFGERPFENSAIYAPSIWPVVHETALGGEVLGKAVGALATLGLPAPEFRCGVLLPPGPASNCVVEVRGAPGSSALIYSSDDLVDWKVKTNLTTTAGWAAFEDLPSATGRRFYRAEASMEH